MNFNINYIDIYIINTMNIAIIPARAGSKRIKNKNIKLFCGKPIIYYSINAAKKSKIFEKIIVSTDSIKIKKFSEKYGAEVPFTRPKNLSDDFTNTIDVIKHTLKKLSYIKNHYNICCIYPTAPLIKKEDLIESLKKFSSLKFNFLFSGCKFTYPIQRGLYIEKNEYIKMINKKNYSKRSQDLRSSYHDAGQFYWATKKTWLTKKKIFDNKSSIFLLPRLRVQDIDNIDDWKIAERLYKLNNEKKNKV